MFTYLRGVDVPLNVVSDSSSIKVIAELPGVKKEDIQIEYKDGILTLAGEKKSELEQVEGHSVYKEIETGSFKRYVRLGEDVDFSSAEADYKEGVVTIRVPKTKNNTPTKLVIK